MKVQNFGIPDTIHHVQLNVVRSNFSSPIRSNLLAGPSTTLDRAVQAQKADYNHKIVGSYLLTRIVKGIAKDTV